MLFFIDTGQSWPDSGKPKTWVFSTAWLPILLMAKEGITGQQNILNHTKPFVILWMDQWAQRLFSTDFNGMVEEGKQLAGDPWKHCGQSAHDQRRHKSNNLVLPKNGIETNCTLVFSAGQAILVAKAVELLTQAHSLAELMIAIGMAWSWSKK